MIKIIDGGVQSLVEDWPGRLGYNGQGMSASGALDNVALQMGNLLVGNVLGEAGIEVTAGFFSCIFEQDAVIALTGCDTGATVNDGPISNWETVFVKKGDVLKMDGYKNGFRAYLTVSGGIDVPQYLGSKSTCVYGNYGGYEGRALQANDIVKIGETRYRWETKRAISPADIPVYENVVGLRAIPGMNAAPDFVTDEGMEYLFSHEFPISLNANRSAVRLEELPDWFFARETGGVGGSHPANIVDHAYNIRGGLNITGNTPSLLVSDGPTLGGFICSLHVINVDLWKIGQAVPGADRLKFIHSTTDEAIRLRKGRREWLTEKIVIS